jgi:hypothetical protein
MIKLAASLAVAAVVSTGCSALTAVNLANPSVGYDLTRDIAYSTHPRMRVDVYTGLPRARPAPVVVFFL